MKFNEIYDKLMEDVDANNPEYQEFLDKLAKQREHFAHRRRPSDHALADPLTFKKVSRSDADAKLAKDLYDKIRKSTVDRDAGKYMMTTQEAQEVYSNLSSNALRAVIKMSMKAGFEVDDSIYDLMDYKSKAFNKQIHKQNDMGYDYYYGDKE